MDRRSFLTTAACGVLAAPLLRAAPGAAPSPALIDTNVHLSHWVTRHSWVDSPATLVRKLRAHGVTSAWTGTFEGVLHTDLAGANARLAEACAREGSGFLRAFGTVNPAFPDWEDDLRRCHELHRMPGVRLYPNYHGYGLDDARVARVLDLAAQRRLLVQIALSLEDDRSQSPVLTAAPVPVGPLADVLAKVPGARVMLLNSGSRVLGASTPLLQRLVAAGVYFEIAALEGVGGIANALQKAPGLRLSFGSHVPYFYFEAALLKLQESPLSPEQLTAIRHGHAEAALALA